METMYIDAGANGAGKSTVEINNAFLSNKRVKGSVRKAGMY
jgi:predicted ABC-type ATPase